MWAISFPGQFFGDVGVANEAKIPLQTLTYITGREVNRDGHIVASQLMRAVFAVRLEDKLSSESKEEARAVDLSAKSAVGIESCLRIGWSYPSKAYV